MYQMFNINLSFAKSLSGLVHFHFEARELKCRDCNSSNDFFCARASSDQLHLHWIQSLSAKLQPNMWPVDHGRMQSIISCVSFPNLGWLVFLRNRVSAIWACAWPGHIWAAAVRTRLAPALSCPPLTLSMNCLPAYSSMLSLIHTPICLI